MKCQHDMHFLAKIYKLRGQADGLPHYGKVGSVTVYSTSSARRNANRSSFSALLSFIGLRLVVSRCLFFLPPLSMRSTASSSVATLPLWKYGADLLMSSSVGVLNAPVSFSTLLTTNRPMSGFGASIPIPVLWYS